MFDIFNSFFNINFLTQKFQEIKFKINFPNRDAVELDS